jgi:hypothetical protein
MKFYAQADKRNCGQIAVASITERTVEEIEQIVGHSHGTKTKELAAALRACGFQCGSRAVRINGLWSDTLGIAQVRSDRRSGWHWIAVGTGHVWDGHSESGPWPIFDYLDECSKHGFRITSLLEVKRP